jgi:hypothetical protein
MNDIELICLSALDGIAIVRDSVGCRLVRPPYNAKDCPIVGKEAPEVATRQLGFAATKLTFPDWSGLISYLNEQVALSRKVVGKEIPAQGLVMDLIELAPASVIDEYLDQVERTLLANRRFDQAEDLLISIARSKVVADDWQRLTRTIDLLAKNKIARERFERGIIRIVDATSSLRALREAGELARSEEIAARVRERGSLFAFC